LGDRRVPIIGGDTDQLAALVQQAGDLAVDVGVIQPDSSETDGWGLVG
jgi:hypothetical protein